MWFQFAIEIRHIHLHSLSEFVDGLILQPLPVMVSWKVIFVMLNSVVMGLKNLCRIQFPSFPHQLCDFPPVTPHEVGHAPFY
jgi:hypothetical protein